MRQHTNFNNLSFYTLETAEIEYNVQQQHLSCHVGSVAISRSYHHRAARQRRSMLPITIPLVSIYKDPIEDNTRPLLTQSHRRSTTTALYTVS